MGVEISEMYWMKDNLNIFQTYIDVLTLNYRKTVIIRFEGVMCQILLALLIFDGSANYTTIPIPLRYITDIELNRY